MTDKRKRRRINNPLMGPCIALLAATVIALIACILIFSKYNKSNKELQTRIDSLTAENNKMLEESKNTYTKDELNAYVASASENASSEKEAQIKNYIQTTMEAKEATTSDLLRKLFPEAVVYKGSEGYVFSPIDASLPASTVNNADLVVNEDGTMSYMPGNEAHYKMGIDVSQHQGNINWEKVAESGVDYAIIRVGFRGYGSGALVLDEQFENNISGALSNDIEVGVYFFSQATSEEEIKEELDFLLDAIKPYKVTYPVVIDIEKIEDSSARGNLISQEDRTHYTDIFCQGVIDAGYTPMIYGNLFSLFSMLDISKLTQYEIWFAFYDTYLYYPYKVNTWQYTDSLKIPGISTKVDGNITFTE